MSSNPESFLTGTNAAYIADLLDKYRNDPGSVDPAWGHFFADLEEDGTLSAVAPEGASWARGETHVVGSNGGGMRIAEAPLADDHGAVALQRLGADLGGHKLRAQTLDSIRALMMIRAYRVRGHLIANFDPLGLEGNLHHPELDPKTYGFTDADMDRPIFINHVLGLEWATLNDILNILKQTYCGSIGVEFMHIQDPDEKSWIQRRIESIRNQTQFTFQGKRAIYQRLVEAEGFENFLQVKYTGTKRFGLDGGESLIPALEQILKRGSQLGVEEVVIGMPHRGRLNVLASIMMKPYVAMLAEFQGISSMPEGVQGSGDVKYHLGTSADRVFDGKKIHLSLTANPSHLEAVNPVVLGKVRAKQNQRGDTDRKKVMGLLMHGDAAFAGQGLVPESLDLSQLRGYKTGGTIHFIVNNQIGFTTSPSYSRSSPYPSDVAKGIQAPIFHVNGDDPEAVVHVARMAAEFRQEFGRDVIIDMFCYRRHGHNEGDEPMFTQPQMYKTIAKHPTTRTIYGHRLVGEGVINEAEAGQTIDDFNARLESAYQASSDYRPNKADWLEGEWSGMALLDGEEELVDDDTSVSMDLLREVGHALSEPPLNFNINSKILRQLKNKRKMVESGEHVDWALAEALAYGTMLVQGTGVRLSGQDSGRGTFSHRHAVLVDQETEERYIPLNNITGGQAPFEVIDSPLSEAGVLGFEYGYSLADPRTLTIWEAQFGDFANGAQVIIDQFISSGASKWLRMSGLVMLLPHGYEGQGPEHSSARPERYLQLCAENNMQVVNCTTPANFFHALRRQVCRNFRMPLVVMSPKSLLRHKLVTSNLGEMGPDTRFRRVLPEVDKLVLDKKVRRLVVCTGKVYYDLLAARREQGIDDVAIIRTEQLYPFPWKGLLQQVDRYPNAELFWCQEEPANMGAWFFVQSRLSAILEELGRKQYWPVYAGRRAAASPATGSFKKHVDEQTQLVNDALTGNPDKLYKPFRRIVL